MKLVNVPIPRKDSFKKNPLRRSNSSYFQYDQIRQDESEDDSIFGVMIVNSPMDESQDIPTQHSDNSQETHWFDELTSQYQQVDTKYVVNIFKESTEEQGLMFTENSHKKKVIVAGMLDKLIEHLADGKLQGFNIRRFLNLHFKTLNL